MPRPLSEQVVVVTGASSGAGLATARAFAARGARVVLAARNAEALDREVAHIRASGGEALAVPTDVAVEAQVQALASAAVAAYGRIDTWVNNAGVTAYAGVREQAAADVAQVMAVNFMGQVHGAQAALPHLEQTGGALICTSSVLADLSVPYQAAYCASKAAVMRFMESLRIELEKDGSPVRVTVVKPSSMNTPLFSKARTQMGALPRPLGPTYEPEVFAEVVLRAAKGNEREAYVGGAGKGAALMQRAVPTLVEAFIASPLATSPASDTPKSASAPDNLFSPTAEDGGVRGVYSDRAYASSPYQSVAGHPAVAAALAAGALGAGAALTSPRDRTLGALLGAVAVGFAGKALTSLLTRP